MNGGGRVEQLNIGYLITQYPPHTPAGLGRYVEALVPYLRSTPHRWWVLTVNPGGLPPVVHDGAIRIYRPLGLLGRVLRRRPLNPTRRLDFVLLTVHVVASNLQHLLMLQRGSLRRRLDLLVVHDSTNALTALLAHRLLRVPIVFHVHAMQYSLSGDEARNAVRDRWGVVSWLERRLAEVSARIVVATPELAERLVQRGWPSGAIRVVPLGSPHDAAVDADGDIPRSEASPMAALPRNARIVLFVGRLEMIKGVDALVAAMPELVRRQPDANLVLAGSGDRRGLEAQARRLGIADRVHFLGFLDQRSLRRCYDEAEVCAFPSRMEPFGLVATEAMARGRPVVLGSGFSTLLSGDPGRCSALRSAVEPHALAVSLDRVLSSAELREELGRRGRELAESFRWDTTARVTVALYEEVVSERSSVR